MNYHVLKKPQEALFKVFYVSELTKQFTPVCHSKPFNIRLTRIQNTSGIKVVETIIKKLKTKNVIKIMYKIKPQFSGFCSVCLFALNKKTAAKTLAMKQDKTDQVIDNYFPGNLITTLIIITNSKFSYV